MGRVKGTLTGFNFIVAIVSNTKKVLIGAAPFVATSAATIGFTVPVANELAERNDRVIEQRQTEAIAQIQDAGSDNLGLIQRNEDNIVVTGEEAETGIIASKEESLAELQAEAERLTSELNESASALSENDQMILTLLATRVQELTLADSIIEDKSDLTDTTNKEELEATQDQIIVAFSSGLSGIQTQVSNISNDVSSLEGRNVVGELIWVYSGTPDPIYYEPCDGTTAPDVNGSGAFIRGGTPDGVINPFTTSASGLSVAAGGAHTHGYFQGNNEAAHATGGGLNNIFSVFFGQTASAGNHAHGLTGAAETRPINVLAQCYVRIL